jgi:hypothetical protein
VYVTGSMQSKSSWFDTDHLFENADHVTCACLLEDQKDQIDRQCRHREREREREKH